MVLVGSSGEVSAGLPQYTSDQHPEKWLVWGRGDLGYSTMGNWNIPYIQIGNGMKDCGPASSQVYFQCRVNSPTSIQIGCKFSAMHDYSMRQIDFARAAFPPACPSGGAAGVCSLPQWRSGGSVRRNPRGREFPMARAITMTQAGRAHPLLASRPAVFDALCSHLDEIETMPPNSEVLAANELSAIQAIATQTPWRGSFRGTQYHPEHSWRSRQPSSR